MLNVDTRLRLTPAVFQLWNSELTVTRHTFVKAQFFHMTQPSKKLSEKYLGLYEIIARPGSHSVTLQLPDSLRAVHPVFHVSMLEPAIPNAIPG